jgi:HEPN domain-containing protein
METHAKYEYWLDIARYDLETAEAMLISKRWLYVVFMCQQAIEKLAKGLYAVYIDDNIPRIHNINSIIERFEDKLPKPISKEHQQLFDKLSAFYLNNRYPDYINKLSAQVIETEAKEILAKTKGAFTWLLTLKQ